MLLFDILRSPEKKAYFRKCWDLQNDTGFRNWIMREYHNKGWVKIEDSDGAQRGDILYYIGEYGGNVGFFSEVIFTLFRLYYADDRGFIPYVNWGSNNLYYEPSGVDGEKNVFLYYFDQVTDIVSDKETAHMIRSTYDHIHELQDQFDTHGYDISQQYMECLSSMVRKYIHYNKKTQKYLDDEYMRLLGDKKTIAVHFRGTDYRRQYNNHPVFVTPEQEIEKVKALVDKGTYEQVFLATDEQAAIVEFQKAFGDRLKVFNDVLRAGPDTDSVAYSHSNRVNHHYHLGLEVLRDQYMLTRCSALVCGISNLTIVARLMRNAWYAPYEDLIVINNGICRNDKVFADAVH